MVPTNNRPKPGRGPVWLSGGEWRTTGFSLAAEAKDALDVAGEAALAFLLHLVIQGRKGHVVEGKIEKQRLAGDWLEVRRELYQVGLFSHEGRVDAEHFQAVAQRLSKRYKKVWKVLSNH